MKLQKNLLSFFILFSFPLLALAQEVNMYEQPAANAKVVAKIDLAAGVMPIFTPQGSEWVKVADPKNGNVGWIKASELATANQLKSTVTFTQSIDKNTAAPASSYNIIQFGNQKPMTEEEKEAFAKKFEMQQKQLMENMNKFFENINSGDNNTVPVVIFPAPKMPAVQPQATVNNPNKK